MATIRHIAITSEDSFVTAELMKRGFGLKEVGRGDSEPGREAVLADGYVNLAVVCWKRAAENPEPHPGSYGLDHLYVLAGVKFDLSSRGWQVASA